MFIIQEIDFGLKKVKGLQTDKELSEITLTKTKLKIVFNNDNNIIIKKEKNEDKILNVIVEEPKQEIQEEIQEELQEEIKEEIQEEIEEEIEEEIKEEEPKGEEKKLSLEEMLKLLKEQIPKQNTFESYKKGISDVYNYFKLNDINELLTTKEKEIIDYIESKYANYSTIKSKLCGVYKCYKVLNIESDLIKNKIDDYRTKTAIETDKNKEANKKDEDEGNIIIESFKKHFLELKQKIKDDTTILTEWKQEVQLYCILKLYLEYGVLRPSELISIKISNSDLNHNCVFNYINIQTKKIVINNHKNDRKGSKIFDIDDAFINILKFGLNNFLITTHEGEMYSSSSSFTKLFSKNFNYTPYDLRRAISSNVIAEGNSEEIKKLEYIQGHSLNIILSNYNVYSKKKK